MSSSYLFSGDDFGDEIIGDEIVGDLISGDLISGDLESGDDLAAILAGDDSIMGAAAAQSAKRRLMMRAGRNRFPVKAGLNAMVNARGIDYKPFQPRKVREYPLGFDSGTAVAAGATAQIIQAPQIPFKGTRLVVPSDIAGLFLILDLRVGKNSQFVSAGSVPARTFAENGVSVTLSLDTAQVSQQIVLSVQNFSGAAARFTASLIGTGVED